MVTILEEDEGDEDLADIPFSVLASALATTCRDRRGGFFYPIANKKKITRWTG